MSQGYCRRGTWSPLRTLPVCRGLTARTARGDLVGANSLDTRYLGVMDHSVKVLMHLGGSVQDTASLPGAGGKKRGKAGRGRWSGAGGLSCSL